MNANSNLINYNNLITISKQLTNPRNYYDAPIVLFKYLPPKQVAATAAALSCYVALYMLKPETLLGHVAVIGGSSVLSWMAAETAHSFACKAFDKRVADLPKQEINQQEKSEISNMLDNLGI